ncbi:sel1 repeat family protein [Aliiruegeria sabulilitoris]|uniref:sel1 repeat family protein n=1 Tax=Aliiruegeria sabulilitoris TaxID=1510458 RepID=UPI00082D0B5A|nr:sel1 repeat family protein [Aliiruegeria sabulilitoris]NDR58268.1 sel1 repeat family protein [Pseudoruegeria sp. M32A2M]
MALFRKPFFKSGNSGVEADYIAGVTYIQRGDWAAASRHFLRAAEGGHISALYNLSLIWGSGTITPYDFDAAADCWYKAAAAGHPKAKESLWLLEAADRGGFGSDNLVALLQSQPGQGDVLPAVLMICAARFYDVVCKQYGATSDVIAYELDGAMTSDWKFVHDYVKRTGIDRSVYEGGLERLKEGSAADQVTDGLNDFSNALRQKGFDQKLIVMARCSIVGYIIQKSPFGGRAEALRGADSFFR